MRRPTARRTASCYPARVRFLALCSVLAGVGCGLAAPSRGTSLSPTSARATFEVRAHGTDIVPVHVVFPAEADGSPRPGLNPGLVFIQGGAAATSRYVWQAQALAEQGFVVALPEHPNALAFFAVDNGLAALDLLSAPPSGSLLVGRVDAARVGVAGHSLGGVVAVKLALSKRLRALVIQDSFADPADHAALSTLAGMPSLSLAADRDTCEANEASIAAGWAKLPSPTVFVRIPGASHYQFTESQRDDERSGCVPSVSLESTHARIADVMTRFLSTALADGGIDPAALGPAAQVSAR